MSAISVPALTVNGIPIPIKPNSLMWEDGLGEYKIRIASAGGSATTSVFTKDIETALGMVKFVLYTTNENVDTVRGWKVNDQANLVEFSDFGGLTRSMSNAAIINKPQYEAGVEGEVEVEFNGDALV